MSSLDYTLAEHGKVLRVTGNLASDWRRHDRTYCFSERVQVDAGHGKWLSVALSLFPRPGGFSRVHGKPNLPAHWSAKHHGINFELTPSSITVRIPLAERVPPFSDDTPWSKTPTGKPRLHVRDDSILQGSRVDGVGGGWINYFELQLLLVIEPLDRAPPVVTDHFRRFFPGGLPGLGRRR